MVKAFISAVNMSLTASVIILAVLVFRALICRRGRIFSYLLWSVVLFRLLCPVSVPGPGSLLGMLQSGASHHGRMEYVAHDTGFQAQPEIKMSGIGREDGIGIKLPEGTPEASVNPVQVWLFIGSGVWVLGMIIMGGYTLVSGRRLRRRLKSARQERGRIYRFPGRGTPFVYGAFRTKIFLPEDLDPAEEGFILRHEEIHVRRHDPLWRMLAWVALGLHWFNPLVWLAFFASERDMEMACDEAVIRELGPDVKKAYTSSLLSMAAGRSRTAGIPIAFGEQDTGSRIRNVLRYKKPKRPAALGLTAICAVLILWMMMNPGEKKEDAPENETVAEQLRTEPGKEAGAEETAAEKADTDSYEEITQMSLADGNYLVRAESIDWDEKGIARYLIEEMDADAAWTYPVLKFSETCVYDANVSMNQIEIENLGYDGFRSTIEENGIDYYVILYCVIKDGQIRQVYLPGSYYGYGISYAAPSEEDNFAWQQEAAGMDAEELLAAYYRLDSTETADVSDAPGKEQIEVYTGNVGDGESGYVLIRNADGSLLHSEWAHESRAGWNNIYLGELDGTAYLMTLHMENREEYGSYGYQVYRMDEDGAVRQIAGSTLEWNSGSTRYSENLFREWTAQMSAYLENSHLLLSTQEGEIRTEKVNEADKYNFDAWKGYGEYCLTVD